MKDGFAERFEQFKTNKSTLAFIVNPLNTNTNEINIEPFGIDAGSLQMQLLDLKTKDLWRGKFTELKSKLEELGIQKCMHIAQHKWTALKEIPRVETLIFGARNSLPECYSEVKQLAYGVLTIFGLPTPVLVQNVTDTYYVWLISTRDGLTLPLTSLTAKATCEALLTIFMRTGIPNVIASDNGTNFNPSLTQEFEKRM
ncbi:hypothetical protein AVEN_113960-1 [Araneus ventricosus]|uniref:Integrase catalytic domain-containing protein n=1 Tax=Araneus ventricosus TaxID=182803 RepID=A0A4Y2WLM1_ARAVE|nr:hypothetical protein AVEN_113960-1 [Araneus ventricosus]